MNLGVRRTRFVVKFTDAIEVRVLDKRFVSGKDLISPLYEVLAKTPPVDVFPVFGMNRGGSEISASEKGLGLDRYFCIVLEIHANAIEKLLDDLRSLPFVEDAYIETETELAS